jgi:hypothetical protein
MTCKSFIFFSLCFFLPFFSHLMSSRVIELRWISCLMFVKLTVRLSFMALWIVKENVYGKLKFLSSKEKFFWENFWNMFYGLFLSILIQFHVSCCNKCEWARTHCCYFEWDMCVELIFHNNAKSSFHRNMQIT